MQLLAAAEARVSGLVALPLASLALNTLGDLGATGDPRDAGGGNPEPPRDCTHGLAGGAPGHDLLDVDLPRGRHRRPSRMGGSATRKRRGARARRKCNSAAGTSADRRGALLRFSAKPRSLRVPLACHSCVVDETRTFSVSLGSKDKSHAVDVFYKYQAEQLPEVGETIHVVRFLRGRVIRARVTRVDATGDPQIAATQIN